MLRKQAARLLRFLADKLDRPQLMTVTLVSSGHVRQFIDCREVPYATELRKSGAGPEGQSWE